MCGEEAHSGAAREEHRKSPTPLMQDWRSENRKNADLSVFYTRENTAIVGGYSTIARLLF